MYGINKKTKYLFIWNKKNTDFLSFAENMDESSGKDLRKNLDGKYSKNIFDHAKQSARDALKTTSKMLIQKKSTSNKWFDW